MTRTAVLFLHPGYNAPLNMLFSLPRADHTDTPGVYGVHHRTALTACQIVANNAWSGYLALDAKGDQRVDVTVGPDDTLTEDEYYLVVPGDDRYPIVPSQDWRFPHNHVPEHWPRPPPTETTSKDICVISKVPWAVHKAHILPRAEMPWFNRNSMSRYSSRSNADLDDAKNLLPLKCDLHACMDSNLFALVPKACSNINGGGGGTETAPTGEKVVEYAVHVLEGDQTLFTSLYHDLALPHLRGIASEYLFARFAQGILMKVKPFLNAGCKRRIVRFLVQDSGGAEMIEEDLAGHELQARYGGGKTRTVSPTKRKRTSDGGAQDGDGDFSSGSTSGDKGEGPEDWYTGVDEERRGRSRKRKRHRGVEDYVPSKHVYQDVVMVVAGEGSDRNTDIPSLCTSGTSLSMSDIGL